MTVRRPQHYTLVQYIQMKTLNTLYHNYSLREAGPAEDEQNYSM